MPFRGCFRHLKPPCSGCWCSAARRLGEAPTLAAPHRCHTGSPDGCCSTLGDRPLIDDLIHGSAVTNDPARLLAAGALVWLGNNLSFSLLYWLIDSGGPIMRARQPLPADFAFTQHMSPELAQQGWRPVFLDYLHLGFTNATAFSPTDVMPPTHRAKYTMLVQSTIALALFGLIVARAVNAFT